MREWLQRKEKMDLMSIILSYMGKRTLTMFKFLGVYLLQVNNASILIIESIQQQYSKPLITFSSNVMGVSNKHTQARIFKITCG